MISLSILFNKKKNRRFWQNNTIKMQSRSNAFVYRGVVCVAGFVYMACAVRDICGVLGDCVFAHVCVELF